MNLENRRELKQLYRKMYIEETKVYRIVSFLEKNEKLYKKKESLEAIEKIRQIAIMRVKRYEEIKNKFNSIFDEIKKTCTHEIILSDAHCIVCAICEKNMLDIPSTSKIKICLPPNEDLYGFNSFSIEQRPIFKKIYQAIESDDIEDGLENLQYDNEVKIRRLKR